MKRRWSFRQRMTALIAAVFVLSAVCLLTVQYFLVKMLLSGAVVALGDGPMPGLEEMSGVTSTVTQVLSYNLDADGKILNELLLWSILVLVVFTGVAVVAANWLSGRSLGRIGQINTTAQQITGANRGGRLALQGPDDEIKELGDTIDGMLGRLDDALTRQERFVSAASHELRTPLATARTALEVPYTQGKFGQDTVKSVERALAANRRSEELLAALLTLASVQAEAGMGISAASARAAYVEAVAENLPLADEASVQLQVESVEGTLGEGGLLQVAVSNLIKNAIIHGGGQVWATVAFRPGAAEFAIVNEGEVMSAEYVAKLVEPFNRGSRTKLSGGGLGLGLTVVGAVAEHYAGKLELAPREDGGLDARITVPLDGE